MSYATRLAAMSREGAPKQSPRVIGGEPEAPREEHVETSLRAPLPPAAPPRSLGSRPAPVIAPSPRDDAAVRAGAAHVTRETTEHTVIEHHATHASPPPHATRAEPTYERAALPAASQWLEEDRSAPDPLVAIAETDALRELMQRVRQWTSSAPTVIETADPTAPVDTRKPAAAAPIAPAPPPEPSHVSIGNVVITVEDAPAATPRGTRSPAPARSTTDRMARNYIRGG